MEKERLRERERETKRERVRDNKRDKDRESERLDRETETARNYSTNLSLGSQVHDSSGCAYNNMGDLSLQAGQIQLDTDTTIKDLGLDIG
jgi:hypothetical protein